MRRLSGKDIIIFGSATGIGASTARRLAEEGAQVCLADINLEDARGVAEDITAAGGKAFAIPLDISDEASVNARVEQAMARLGKLDGVHINAADMSATRQDTNILEFDLDTFDRTMAVNLRGHLLCTREVLPHLLKNTPASIVYTSSVGMDLGGSQCSCLFDEQSRHKCVDATRGDLLRQARHNCKLCRARSYDDESGRKNCHG